MTTYSPPLAKEIYLLNWFFNLATFTVRMDDFLNMAIIAIFMQDVQEWNSWECYGCNSPAWRGLHNRFD